MIDISSHQAYGALKKILNGMQVRNFKEFNQFVQKNALSKANNWKYDVDNYGFSRYEKRFFENIIFNEQLFKDTIYFKILGDALEIFAAFFCQWFEHDIQFGIKAGTWKFTGDLDDLGCDAIGELGSNSSKCFIQVKYRSSPKAVPFNLEVFSKLFTQATISYGLDYKDPRQRLMFFTNIPINNADRKNAQSLPFIRLASQCKVPVVLIGKNEIEQLTGDSKHSNIDFWKSLNDKFTS